MKIDDLWNKYKGISSSFGNSVSYYEPGVVTRETLLSSYGGRFFKRLGAGAWREAYAYKDMVVKLPQTGSGCKENVFEYAFYKEEWAFLEEQNHTYFTNFCAQAFIAYFRVLGQKMPLNPCEVVDINGYPGLIAEKLDRQAVTERPWWHFLTDGYQAGVNSKGEALLYDYNCFDSWSVGYMEEECRYRLGEQEGERVFSAILAAIPERYRPVFEKGEWLYAS